MVNNRILTLMLTRDTLRISQEALYNDVMLEKACWHSVINALLCSIMS